MGASTLDKKEDEGNTAESEQREDKMSILSSLPPGTVTAEEYLSGLVHPPSIESGERAFLKRMLSDPKFFHEMVGLMNGEEAFWCGERIGELAMHLLCGGRLSSPEVLDEVASWLVVLAKRQTTRQ